MLSELVFLSLQFARPFALDFDHASGGETLKVPVCVPDTCIEHDDNNEILTIMVSAVRRHDLMCAFGTLVSPPKAERLVLGRFYYIGVVANKLCDRMRCYALFICLFAGPDCSPRSGPLSKTNAALSVHELKNNSAAVAQFGEYIEVLIIGRAHWLSL